MDKKPSAKDKARVVTLLSDFEFLFGLQGYDRNLTFRDTEKDLCVADICVEEDYSRVYINIYPRFWDNSLKDQRMYLLHEFVHSWVQPINLIAANLQEGKLETSEHRRFALERSVSVITNAMDGLLRLRYKYARKAYQKYLKK